jgi:hypothetical protein
MAYVRKWIELAEAVKLVMASGLSRSEAKRDICAALVDREIRFRTTLPADFSFPMDLIPSLRAPSDLRPLGIDWAHSRPKNKWPSYYGRGHLVPIAKIEVLTKDVSRVLGEGDFEAAATQALAIQLKRKPDTKRDDAKVWCVGQGFALSGRGFQFRVWPDARKLAGLSQIAPSGRKPKSLRPE